MKKKKPTKKVLHKKSFTYQKKVSYLSVVEGSHGPGNSAEQSAKEAAGAADADTREGPREGTGKRGRGRGQLEGVNSVVSVCVDVVPGSEGAGEEPGGAEAGVAFGLRRGVVVDPADDESSLLDGEAGWEEGRVDEVDDAVGAADVLLDDVRHVARRRHDLDAALAGAAEAEREVGEEAALHLPVGRRRAHHLRDDGARERVVLQQLRVVVRHAVVELSVVAPDLGQREQHGAAEVLVLHARDELGELRVLNHRRQLVADHAPETHDVVEDGVGGLGLRRRHGDEGEEEDDENRGSHLGGDIVEKMLDRVLNARTYCK
jgi:hypothetical protein